MIKWGSTREAEELHLMSWISSLPSKGLFSSRSSGTSALAPMEATFLVSVSKAT